MRGEWMLGDKPSVIGKGNEQAVVIERVGDQALYQEREGYVGKPSAIPGKGLY
jgi:hypothetical protein